MPLTLGAFQHLSLKSALKLFSPFVCLFNMLREQKTSNHEDLGFPPHGSAAGPSLGPRPGHNQLLTGPQAGLAVFLFFIKKKSQTEAPKLPPPDIRGPQARPGGQPPGHTHVHSSLVAAAGLSFILNAGQCRPPHTVLAQPAPPLGRGAPFSLPPVLCWLSGRGGSTQLRTHPAHLKADDVPTGADRSRTSSSRTGEVRGCLRARRLVASPPEPGPQARVPWETCVCRRERSALSQTGLAQGLGLGAWTVPACSAHIRSVCVINTWTGNILINN